MKWEEKLNREADAKALLKKWEDDKNKSAAEKARDWLREKNIANPEGKAAKDVVAAASKSKRPVK